MSWTTTDASDPEPRPSQPAVPPLPRRQVYASLTLTVGLLVATVGLVYALFPQRDHVFATRALAAHRGPGPSQLATPTLSALHAWAAEVFDDGVPSMEQRFEDPPLPQQGVAVVGARSEVFLGRPTAVIQYQLGGDIATLVVQRGRGVGPKLGSVVDGDVQVETWRHGGWIVTVVGNTTAVAALRAQLP